MAARQRKGSLVWAQPVRLRAAAGAYLRCPNCHGTDLQMVSLAYQEGLFHTVAHTRLRGVVIGGSGPDLLVARAITRGFQQSALSKQLDPPVKWSYRKLILWSVLALLSVGWIVFYVNTITRNSSVVLSTPLIVFALFLAIIFVLLFVLAWKHNESTYKAQYSQWERSFLCQRCGTLRHVNGARNFSATKSATWARLFGTAAAIILSGCLDYVIQARRNLCG